MLKEHLEEIINECLEYKRKNPGIVFGEDFPLVAKLLMQSPRFYQILMTCHTEHLMWCASIAVNGAVNLTKDMMMESELFKWMGRVVYIGVQLGRRETLQGGIDAALESIEKQSGEMEK